MTTAGVCDQDLELIDELFHALSQPLTSLRCCTEVALLEPRTSEEYCEVLQQSLELSEQISELAGAIREMWDSQSSKGALESISLQNCLDGIVADLLPVAEAEDKVIVLSGVPSQTKIEVPMARRGLSLIVQYAMAICATRETIKVEAQRASIRIAVSRRISDPGRENKKVVLRRRFGMAIARRSLESVGCTCREQVQAEGWLYEVLVPAEWEKT